jgi:hypothetical protein
MAEKMGFIVEENQVRVDLEDVAFYFPQDNVDPQNIAAATHDLVFVLKSKHEVRWVYKLTDVRNAVLAWVDTLVQPKMAPKDKLALS